MSCLPEDVRALALLLPETIEGAHQGHPDFRVGGRIFATLWTDEARVVVRLTPEAQARVLEDEPDAYEPCPAHGVCAAGRASISTQPKRRCFARRF